MSVCCLMLHLPVKKTEDELIPWLPSILYLYMRDIVIVCPGYVLLYDLVTCFIEINKSMTSDYTITIFNFVAT